MHVSCFHGQKIPDVYSCRRIFVISCGAICQLKLEIGAITCTKPYVSHSNLFLSRMFVSRAAFFDYSGTLLPSMQRLSLSSGALESLYNLVEP